MGISLSPDKERFIAAKIASGQYRSPLEALLLQGIENGESSEMTEDDWADIRREVYQRHAARKAGKTPESSVTYCLAGGSSRTFTASGFK